MLMHMSIAR